VISPAERTKGEEAPVVEEGVKTKVVEVDVVVSGLLRECSEEAEKKAQ